MSGERNDKTRMVLLIAVVLWISAAAAIFVGLRLRVKPILLVGALDGMLALIVTTLAMRGARSR